MNSNYNQPSIQSKFNANVPRSQERTIQRMTQDPPKKVSVKKTPFEKSTEMRTLKWQEEIEIFASVAGAGGRWYQIKEDGTESDGHWVHSKYVKIDKTFDKQQKKTAALEAEDERLRQKDAAKNNGKKGGSKYAAN